LVDKIFLVVESTHDPKIVAPEITLKEYNEAYQKVYNLCSHNHRPQAYKQGSSNESYSVDRIYTMVEESLTNYYKNKVLGAVSAKSGVLRLAEFARRHKPAQENIAKWLTKFLHYIERFYIIQHSKPSIKEMCMCLTRPAPREPTTLKGTTSSHHPPPHTPLERSEKNFSVHSVR